MNKQSSFKELVHAFFERGQEVRWKRLNGDVFYYNAGNGLYILMEVEYEKDTFCFARAKNLRELKRDYFGTVNI